MNSTKCDKCKDRAWRQCCDDCQNKTLIRRVFKEDIPYKDRFNHVNIPYTNLNI